MLLRNLRSVKTNELTDVRIAGSEIVQIGEQRPTKTDAIVFNFEDAIVFPGLINSHDHLEFNLFSRLGNKIYQNYVEWGEDIHKQNKAQIQDVLAIPKSLRIQWGIYKNLINGVTTVVHHGDKIEVENGLINIFQDNHVLHSARLEKHWKYKLLKPWSKHFPYTMHMGEGTDVDASKEIDEVIKWNFWNKEIVGVHGILMNTKQAQKLKALIWCADSNFFLNGTTANIAKLKQHTKILFGTDSTVSADWNIWNQLHIARSTKMVSDAELFDMLNSTAAAVWKLQHIGEIKEKYKADLVIAKNKKHENAMESFFAIQPEDILLVMSNGKIKLIDETLRDQIPKTSFGIETFSTIKVGNANKLVTGNINALIDSIISYYPNVALPISV